MWTEKKKYKFFLIFTLFDIIMSGLTFIRIYDIKTTEINESKNFQLCNINIYLLIFLEWNVVRFSKGIKTIISSIYINCLVTIILIIFNTLEINNYKTRFIINTTIILLSVFSYYFFIYGIRILFIKKR